MLGFLALVPTFGPLVASLTGVWMGYLSLDPALSASEVCRALEHAVSNETAVHYYPGVAEAPVDIARWSNPSTHPSACSITPGSDKDLATVLRLVGAARMTFAVMGGSQDPHPGVSSGKGIHISLKRFDEASYDNSTSTVTVGSGLSWNDVTNVLAPHAATIGGTRASSFGLDNSWLPDQRSQARNALVSCDLILPNGKIRTISESSDPELFSALKSGFNDYGIVTKFTLKTSSTNNAHTTEGDYANADIREVLTGAPVDESHGADVARLRAIRRRVDPWRVMDLASAASSF